MAQESARMLFGAAASGVDGHCGALVRVVVEPEHGTVTHLVIEPEHRIGLGHLVPLDQVASAEGVISLRLTRAEFEQLPRSETVRSPAGVASDAAPGDEEAPVGTSPAWPMFGANATVPETEDRVPADEVEIRPGEDVEACDGTVGQVEGVVVEAVTARLTHVLIREGHVWRRKKVAIPADAVSLLGPDRLVLSLTRNEVGALPPTR